MTTHSKKQREGMAGSPPGKVGAYEALATEGKSWHGWGQDRCPLLPPTPAGLHRCWCWCLLICWCAEEGSRGNGSLDTDVGWPNPLGPDQASLPVEFLKIAGYTVSHC